MPYWPLHGLGQAGEVKFSRSEFEVYTLPQWQIRIKNGLVKTETDEGVKYIRVQATSGENTSEWVRIYDGDKVPKGTAKKLFKDGGFLAHPTRGSVNIPQFIYLVDKGIDQIVEDAAQPKTLRGCGFAHPERELSDIQATNWAKSDNFKGEVALCHGIGTRTGSTYRLQKGGDILWTAVELSAGKEGDGGKKTDVLSCPASILEGSGRSGDVPAMREDAQAWSEKHPCIEMVCKTSSGSAVRFFNQPSGVACPPPIIPGAGGGEDGGDDEKKTDVKKMAMIGGLGLGALVVLLLILRKD